MLHAIDVATGRDRWEFDGGTGYGSDLSTSPLLTADGLLIWPGPGSRLYGLDAVDGRVRWTLRLGGEGRSPQLLPGGDVVVGDSSGGVRAIDVQAGREPQTVWQVDVGTFSYGSPAVGSDGTVYTTVDQALVAIADGAERWRVETGGLVEVSPAVSPDGTVSFASNDRFVRGIRPSGRERWRYRLGDLSYSSPAATQDGLIYIGDHFGRVTALSVTDGLPRLVLLGRGRTPDQLDVGVWTQPIVDAAHNVYFGTRPGHIYGFTADGRERFDIDAGATVDSYPALAADGTLLIGSESGELLAIE